MKPEVIIEIVGYVGSLLVLVSMLMTSVVKLRVVNTIGSVIFTIYAFIIGSIPTAVMNIAIIIINVQYLWKMSKMGKEYEVTRVNNDDQYLEYLLSHYHSDIMTCFPGITMDYSDANVNYIINCEGKPVGMTIGVLKDTEIELLLDYTIPEYRDFSIGRFLMGRMKSDGIETIVYKGPDVNHKKYLESTGYVKTEEGYVKKLV